MGIKAQDKFASRRAQASKKQIAQPSCQRKRVFQQNWLIHDFDDSRVRAIEMSRLASCRSILHQRVVFAAKLIVDDARDHTPIPTC